METQVKVLLVDDEASVRRQLSIGLMQSGFDVEDCEDGLSALKKIEAAERNKSPYHFIVTDIRLPDINGLKLLQVIKSKYPELPVVVISGYGDERTKTSVADSYGNAYLDKPFDVTDLEATFKRIGLPEKEEAGIRPRAAVEQRQVSAYVFIRGSSDVDLNDIYTSLYFADGVLYCDAVIGEGAGEWDIVILVQAPDKKGIERIVKTQVQALKGVKGVEIHHAERPWLGEDIESFIKNYERMNAMEKPGEEVGDKRNRRSVSAYAMLEIDRSQLVQLYSKLYFTDNIVYCDATDSGNMMILFVQAQNFDQIRRTIANEIRTQPGVLRVKMMNIVEIIAM